MPDRRLAQNTSAWTCSRVHAPVRLAPEKQNAGSASQRVRGRLHASTAAFHTSAMWAAIHCTAQDSTSTRRAFEQAQDTMLRADPADYRPVWMLAFYDQAELDSLVLSAYLALGDYPAAEYHAHRCLSALRPHMVRSRAIATTRLAHAQLAQGAADAATAAAMTVTANAATQHARVARMLQEFGAALRATAPRTATVQTWTEHVATWRTTV
ncbi:hypothetical protein [Streptomyces sp. NPDC059788]|uniref:hypothetical protein n=1 Tax=Streptomyces sp. NPDC059788 TaxID=3346948 RepID=UPI00364F005A